METPDCFKDFYSQQMSNNGFFNIHKIIDLNSLKDIFTSVCVRCCYCLHYFTENMSWLSNKSV